MNHKYFPNKQKYNTWILENPSIELLDYTELTEGVYIEYVQMKPPKKVSKRNRLWSENLYQ